MRRWVVAAVLASLLVVIPPTVMPDPAGFPHLLPAPQVIENRAAAVPTVSPAVRALPMPSQSTLRAPFLHNLTMPGPATPQPLAGRVPNSARFDTPPPPLPGTVPTVLTFLNYSTGCCVEENFSVPSGTWASIVLNYTGLAAGSVYDSSYRAYIDGTLVLFGTTPEYGTWTVLQNLSQYSTLLHGTANLTFLLGAALSTGYFRTNVSIAFYPVPTGGSPPPAPNEIVPLWEFKSVTSSTQTVYTNATVPTNASAAVLQLYAFPFMDDEFFWGGATAPNPSGLRVVEFGLNSTPLAAMLPFPFVQTGGIDFFLWRPISAVYTLDMPPLELNVTAALGSLEGSHQYWAQVHGVDQGTSSPSGAKWLIEGSLLLWTNSTMAPASPQAATFTAPVTTVSGGVQQSSANFGWASELREGAHAWNVTSTTSLAFSDVLAQPYTGTWKNLTETSTVVQQTSTETSGGNDTERRMYAFGISTDWGPIAFHETSSTMGGYPILGNFTTELLNTNQQWDETVTDWAPTPSGPAIVAQHAVDDQLVDASGTYGGEMEVQSATSGAVIIAFNASTSATTKEYVASDGPPTDATVYGHLLSGSALNPPMPYVAETVVVDSVQTTPFPLRVDLAASPRGLDLGSPLDLSATPAGGIAPYGFAWSGLPSGCSATNTSVVTCTPSTVGTFDVSVSVRDAAGNLAAAPVTPIEVVPDLRAGALTTTPGVDVGGNATFFATISGGVPPVSCAWTVGTTTTNGSCATPFSVPAATAGPMVVALTALDATGRTARAPTLNITVAPTLTVAAFLVPSGGTVPAGTPVSVVAQSAGGTGPYTFNWTLNGTPLAGAGGWNLTYVPPAPGTYLFAVTVSDAAGGSVLSNGLTLTVTPALSKGSGSSGSAGGSTVPDWVVYGLVGLALVEAGAIALLLSMRRPPPRPAVRRPAPAERHPRSPPP